MAVRQVSVLGRHSDMSIGWFPMSLEQPRRQRLLLASWRNMQTLMPGISLNPLQLKLWASATLQLVTSWMTLVGEWLSTVI